MFEIKKYLFEFKKNPIKGIIALICCILFFVEISSVFIFTMMESAHLIPILITILFSFFVVLYSYLFTQIRINVCIAIYALFILYAFVISVLGKGKIHPYFITLLRMFLMFYTTYLFCINFYNLKFLTLVYIVAGLLFSLIFSIAYFDQIFNFSTFSDGRLGYFFGSVNYAGSTIGFTLLICSIYVSIYRKPVSIYYILSLFLIFLIFKTGCRSAFIVSLISIFVCSVFLFWKKHKIVFLLIVGAISSIIVLLLLLPSSAYFRNRFFAMFSLFQKQPSSQDMSFNERFMMQFSAYQFWLKNLFFGYGTDSFAVISSYGTYSHAGLSELLVNYGIIGTSLFAFPLVYFLSKKFRKTDAFKFYLIFLICYILPELFDGVFFYEKKYWLFMALCFANFSSVEKDSERSIFIIKYYYNFLPKFYYRGKQI